MYISVAHRWMVLRCTCLILFGQVIKLNGILQELVLSMNTYPAAVEVLSFLG